MEPENAGFINQLTRSVLRRPALLAIIYGYKLYPAQRAKMPLEDVIGEMKNDIQIRRDSVLPGGFSIRFA